MDADGFIKGLGVGLFLVALASVIVNVGFMLFAKRKQ